MSTSNTERVKCIVCGAVFDAAERICPICGVGAEYFEPVSSPKEEEPPEARCSDSAPAAREEERFLIIGGGIAAVVTAEEIRRLHSDASIVMICEETALPYHRPALSKAIPNAANGERFALHPPEWYSRHGIFLLSGRRAARILPRGKQVELSDGELMPYDKCILATGARSVIPSIEGSGLPGVFSLRTLSDLEAIAAQIRPDLRAAVIGGGVLGLEAAWQLYLGGCHVTVLEAAEQLLAGRITKEVSDRIIRLAAEREVEIRTSVSISRLEGEDRVRQIILPGEYLNTELALFCCGSQPRVELAREAGLEVDRGILVNSRMMTGKYGIYACGDCAQLGADVCGMWSIAESMGRCAGRNAAGEDTMYHPCQAPLTAEFFGTRLWLAGDCGADGKDCRAEHTATEGGEQFLYYSENRLCGAILLGDLSQASALLEAMERRQAPSAV